MGTRCAPSFVNLYLGGREHDLFSNEDFVDLLSNILHWFRYIDDILMLWVGTVETLDQFMRMLSTNMYNLKFTMQSRTKTIAYLDVTINIGTDGTINTSLYRKPTTGNTILHASSAHPHSLVQSITFGQYLGLR